VLEVSGKSRKRFRRCEDPLKKGRDTEGFVPRGWKRIK
jgi:hypothetical protein